MFGNSLKAYKFFWDQIIACLTVVLVSFQLSLSHRLKSQIRVDDGSCFGLRKSACKVVFEGRFLPEPHLVVHTSRELHILSLENIIDAIYRKPCSLSHVIAIARDQYHLEAVDASMVKGKSIRTLKPVTREEK